MTPTMQVTALVAEMQETLAIIHNTLAALDSSFHDEKLDKLEKKRRDAIQALSSAFSAESELLDRRRRAERDMITELRRKEDEEREGKRREEDEKLAVRDREEDVARDGKLEGDINEIEQEIDKLMSQVEGEAHVATVEGRDKLKELQERRRELNHLIEEQLELTLPTLPVVPTRTRRPTRTSVSPHSQPTYKMLSGDSKAVEPVSHLEPEHGAEHPLDRSGPAPQAGLDTNLSTERIDYGSRDRQQTQDHIEDLVNEPLTENLASPRHQEPQYRPDSPTLTTATISAPAGDNGFSDSEESLPMSWSDENPHDEDIHSGGSEAVAPAPHPTRYDADSPSSYVSDTELHGNRFSHPGETYIEEGECSGLGALHPVLSDVEREERMKERLGHTPEFDEHPPHVVQEVSVQPTLELDNSLLDVPEEHALRKPEEEQKRADEENGNGHLPAQESEVTGTGQEAVTEMVGLDTVSDHGHGRATESNNDGITHDVPELHPTGHAVLGEVEPSPFQGGDLSRDDRTASLEQEGHDSEHNEPRAQEGHIDASVSSDQRKENHPSAEPPNYRAQDAEHEEQIHHPDHGVYHPSCAVESEKDYDTDTDSQHFVTPLPSRHSLRAFSQQQASLARNTDANDYVGSRDYASDDARKHELEHQHVATVHGEDDLFDDTDRSEDHAEPEDVGSERPNTNQQGAPVWRPVLAHQVESAEADADTRAVEGESPELRSPENYVRQKSWAEEVEGYFENENGDEPESQPETPSLRPNETVHGITESDQNSPIRTGLVLSEHHHERPETPAGHESLVSSEYVTPEALATRETANTPRRVSDGWTPQSQDTQSTFSSPPVSPVRSTTADKSEPVPSSHPETEPPVHHYEPQSSPPVAEQDPFIDETERKTPVNLMPPWQRRGSPSQAEPDDNNPHNEGNTGSLFQRMRNMFEQPRSNIPSRDRGRNRDFYASSGRTRPASGAWFSQPADPPPTTQKRFSSFHPPTNTGNSTPRSPRSPPFSPTLHQSQNQN